MSDLANLEAFGSVYFGAFKVELNKKICILLNSKKYF